MDRTDIKILENLQTQGRISNQELADQVALSPSPCLRRVKQLEENGYIQQYTALLDPHKIGLQLTVIVLIGLNNHDSKKMQQFEKTMSSIPEVIQCYLITGQSADYLLKVMVPNLEAYESFLLKKLTVIEDVNQIKSSFVLQCVIDKTALPLNHLD